MKTKAGNECQFFSDGGVVYVMYNAVMPERKRKENKEKKIKKRK
jgi:hypothetical protein